MIRRFVLRLLNKAILAREIDTLDAEHTLDRRQQLGARPSVIYAARQDLDRARRRLTDAREAYAKWEKR